uniref:Uncharacterized protein n=1 Tax=Erythrotrichia carnea TaxID=35151 RepID=A0A1C9CEI4_9RHOD|nr:hypothetical protein Eryt_128 [Erythrotrichia carnea]AOM66796.1 hypothetical protein Eryt_128 [Erythrotrichia carnea]
MTQLLSTTYLIILLFFLTLFSYYLSNEILKNIQQENVFDLPKILNSTTEKELDPLLHLNLAKIYCKKEIHDAALYEIRFLIESADNSYSNIVISNLYTLMGETFENLGYQKEASESYSKAIATSKTNTVAINKLDKLINKN